MKKLPTQNNFSCVKVRRGFFLTSKQFFSSLILSVLLFLIQIPIFSQSAAVSLYEKGLSYMEDEQWYKASESFLSAVNENPSFAEAWYTLSQCSYMLSEFDLVLSQLDEAEKYLKDDPRIDNLRGMTLISLEDFSGARKIFEKVLKKYPNNVEARFGLAELDLFDGKFSGAEKLYSEALKRQNKNRKALLSLALVSAKMGKFDSAKHFLDSAITAYSGEAEVHYLAAVIYAMKGDVKSSEKHCRVSVSINGNYDRAYELLAKTLYAQKKYDEVISICDFRIARDRSLSSAWYLKGLSQYSLGKYEEAVETWSRALRIAEDDEMMRSSLEILANECVPIEDKRRTEWAEYHVNCAKEAESRFDLSAATWEYQRALKVQPSNEKARLAYASILELKGMHELYLDQLLFVKENQNSSDTASSNSSSDSSKKSRSQTFMEDTIEAYSDILSLSLAKKWKVEPFYLDKTRWHLGLYYINSSMHLNHADANRIAAEYAKDVFSGLASASVDAKVLEVSGFAEAYQKSRLSGTDYFVIMSFDEGSRDVLLEYKVYSGRTGYLLLENSLYGTGNQRNALVFRRFRNDIMSHLPIVGKIIARDGKTLLCDLGRTENIREGAVFDIVRKGSLRPAGTSFGLDYKDNDTFGNFTVTTSSEEVSEGLLEYKGFYDRVNTGDSIVLVSLPPTAEENAREGAGEGGQALVESAPSADVNGESISKKSGLTAEDLGIRRTPSFMDIIRSIY